MAYFGDATAHAAILGVALSLALSLPVFAGALVVALVMATAVAMLSGRGYAMDTLLGVMAHSDWRSASSPSAFLRPPGSTSWPFSLAISLP